MERLANALYKSGVTYIAQVLKRNRTLKLLNLSENKIDVQGLVTIAEALVSALDNHDRFYSWSLISIIYRDTTTRNTTSLWKR